MTPTMAWTWMNWRRFYMTRAATDGEERIMTKKRTCSMCHEKDDCKFGYVNSQLVCEFCWETLQDMGEGDYSGLN